MRESEHWSRVRQKLHPDIHATRIENSATAGVSDVTMCRHGIEVWVELKIQKGNMLEFRSSQPVWIRKRMTAGGRVVVLARKEDDLVLYAGGVCFGTTEHPPVPVKGKQAVKVRADAMYLLHREPFADVNWRSFENRIFGG